MKKVIEKIPIWAYTIMLMAAASLASVFVSNIYSSWLASYGLVSVLSPVFYIITIGALYGGLMRLVMRIVYSIGDRIFFGLTKAVPDYNLRRLPIPYNQYVRVMCFWLIVAKLFEALTMSLLVFLLPVAYYMWQFLSAVFTLGCMLVAYVFMDKHYVPTWQSGKCYLSFIIPAAVIYVIAVFL